ncbi:MAG: hypothetical protein JWN27_2998 [Candidatus Eremiobacteraeota bacterium]|nr:hypothetical protein [Candidatus Eremiobacteraeota bacterium]
MTGALLVLALAVAACAHDARNVETTASPAPAPSVSAAPAVQLGSWCHVVPLERSFCSVLILQAPKSTLRLAVQDTQARRERGLMGVRAIPAGEGMLFAFADGDLQHQIWMNDTLVPLDIIFMRSDGMVMAMAENVPATKPGTPDDRIARRNGEGRYVIELASGEAERAGLDVGIRLAIPQIAAR